MRLIFTDGDDLHDLYGKLAFGANRLRRIGAAAGAPQMRARCAVTNPDGSYWLYGLSGATGAPWRILRCRTFDGIRYEAGEVVYEHPAEDWLGAGDLAYSPARGELLCLKWRRGRTGHCLWAFGSKDGRGWRALADKPVYQDHDAFGLMWDERTGRYIAYQTTYQRWKKRYEDNIGSRTRRVLHVRTSPDGVQWQPARNVPFGGPFVSRRGLITPDADDPPELEFYCLTVFPCAGRYVGMMLNYAPSPHVANRRFPWSKHGPHAAAEWWISRDGVNWRRPYRDVFAAGEADGAVGHEPMTIGGRHLWVRDGKVYGLREDRVFFVGCRTNAEFSTIPFEIGRGPLVLNASLCHDEDERRGMRDQAYVMAELRTPDGPAIKGFEKDRCVITHMAGETVALKWGQDGGRSLAGRLVRLRLYLRDARIYSVAVG